MGYSKLMFVFFVLYHFMLSGNFYGLEIQLGIFLVLNFVQGFFGGLLEAPGIFWVTFNAYLYLPIGQGSRQLIL